MNRPTAIKKPNFKRVQKLAEQYMDLVATGESLDDERADYRYYIFEDVIRACYGKGAFEYIRDKTQHDKEE
jgi:hypothetical protein